MREQVLSVEGSSEALVTRSPRGWIERLPTWARTLVTIGTLPGDGEDERLRKASLILTTTMIIGMAIVWVVTYASLGLYVSAAIPFGYQVISIVSLIALSRSGRFDVFRTSQLALMLLLPMLLQWSLGGFVTSSGVLLWALISPLGALVLSPRPVPWFVSYLALTVVSGLLEPFLPATNIPLTVTVLFFVLNVGGVSVVVYFLVRYFIRGLAAEREKSETLLLNVLPASIARRLKNGEHPLADRFDEATVLFADLVGFTRMSEQLSPEAVVELLDDLFTQFDVMAERRGLEKIKTVGDAYMVVGGVPEAAASAAEDVAEMALDMVALVADRPGPNGGNLSLRIGIDTGPVVAGVIGQRKFTYDLWGDTVNTASRMESQGIAGEIQVTPRVYQRLKHQFRFQEREALEVKGKGQIATFLLIGRVGQTTPQPR
ncbi:MAG TPA: adenylate/guanylate cyclase domain-containing protein [Acidimicrobiia bacterium]